MNDGAVVDLTSRPDRELADRVRDGDRTALGILYLRHHEPAWGLACATTGFSADAEIALVEGFACAFSALPADGGAVTVRDHVLACVYRAAKDRAGRVRRRDERGSSSGQSLPLSDPVRAGHALRLLRQDWRAALWLTEVEAMNPNRVSSVIGVDPSRVVSVSHMAWWVVQAAWLQAELRAEAPARCRPALDRLAAHPRGRSDRRDRTVVEAHHSVCPDCSQRARRLTDAPTGLVADLPPVPALGAETVERWLALTQRRPPRPTVVGPAEPPEVPPPDDGATARLWLDPLASSAPAARRFAACTLRRWGSVEVIEVVQLLTSELVTNAAVHARSPVQLVLDHRPAAVRVEVHDRDTTIPTDADKGRGLILVEALADRWGATGTATGKVVWFEVADPQAETPRRTSQPDRPDSIEGDPAGDTVGVAGPITYKASATG